MTNTSIYQDMAQRTGGDIYLGLVGPVRTGKSTFIRRFMETLVIPNIEDVYARERAKDELPQSGSGRTIMTAEPKFVPEDAVNVTLDGGVSFSVRLVDCVGYMVDGASGQFEDGAERMVATPWFDEEVSMSRAAEEGTRRVIAEHSTIGVVMTTDGSICGIPREGYVPAEERVVAELEVNTPSVSTPVRRLSGGNVQKVLVGREIASAPTVLLTQTEEVGDQTVTLRVYEPDEAGYARYALFGADGAEIDIPFGVNCGTWIGNGNAAEKVSLTARDDVLGFPGFELETIQGIVMTVCDFYALTEQGFVYAGRTVGYDFDDAAEGDGAWPLDLTGDGRSELITRSTFGDGMSCVFVYRWNAAEGGLSAQ